MLLRSIVHPSSRYHLTERDERRALPPVAKVAPCGNFERFRRFTDVSRTKSVGPWSAFRMELGVSPGRVVSRTRNARTITILTTWRAAKAMRVSVIDRAAHKRALTLYCAYFQRGPRTLGSRAFQTHACACTCNCIQTNRSPARWPGSRYFHVQLQFGGFLYSYSFQKSPFTSSSLVCAPADVAAPARTDRAIRPEAIFRMVISLPVVDPSE
jgi:hypothetical protein